MLEYKTLEASGDPVNLDELVNEAIKDGWSLHGGGCCGSYTTGSYSDIDTTLYYCQAMTREADNADT